MIYAVITRMVEYKNDAWQFSNDKVIDTVDSLVEAVYLGERFCKESGRSCFEVEIYADLPHIEGGRWEKKYTYIECGDRCFHLVHKAYGGAE